MYLSIWSIIFISAALIMLCAAAMDCTADAARVFSIIFGVIGLSILVHNNIVIELEWVKFVASVSIALTICGLLALLGYWWTMT